QSMRFLQRMSAVGVGVQRPSEILQPSFLNERDDFEFNPNFTVIFTHKRSITQETPHVTRVQSSIHRL
ncbi:phage gateway protein, partial [Bordetella avium]